MLSVHLLLVIEKMDTLTDLHSESETLFQNSLSDNVDFSELVSRSSPMFDWLTSEFEDQEDAIWRDACSELYV